MRKRKYRLPFFVEVTSFFDTAGAPSVASILRVRMHVVVIRERPCLRLLPSAFQPSLNLASLPPSFQFLYVFPFSRLPLHHFPFSLPCFALGQLVQGNLNLVGPSKLEFLNVMASVLSTCTLRNNSLIVSESSLPGDRPGADRYIYVLPEHDDRPRT